MKKVLITGASGFIGRQCLAPLIERGFEVHALALEPLAEYEKDVVWHCQNFLDDEKTRDLIKTVQPGHCLHLAWYTEPGKYWSSPENLKWTASSLTLIQSFQQQGGQRFVGAGTCAEYDWRYGHCSEAITPLEPATLYGTCKNNLQKILASFSENGLLSSAWGRLFLLYGPHENIVRLVPNVINSLLRGERALCTHGNQLRDFMYISDAANALVCLLDGEIMGPVNIASGNPVSIKDVVSKIAQLMEGVDKLKLGALTAKNEPAVLTADVSRLWGEVGFISSVGLELGLDLTIEWWKKQLEENR